MQRIQRGFQRRKDAGKSGRRGSRRYIESIFFEERERERGELGASESTQWGTRIISGRVKMNGIMSSGHGIWRIQKRTKRRRSTVKSKARIWRVRGLGLCGSAHAQATIWAIPVRRNRSQTPGNEKIHGSDSIQRSRNQNGRQHGSSGVRSEEHAYHRRGIRIPDNSHGVSRGKPFR